MGLQIQLNLIYYQIVFTQSNLEKYTLKLTVNVCADLKLGCDSKYVDQKRAFLRVFRILILIFLGPWNQRVLQGKPHKVFYINFLF